MTGSQIAAATNRRGPGTMSSCLSRDGASSPIRSRRSRRSESAPLWSLGRTLPATLRERLLADNGGEAEDEDDNGDGSGDALVLLPGDDEIYIWSHEGELLEPTTLIV